MKILWLADPHVGIKRYGHIDSSGIHTRVLDTIKAIETVVTSAIVWGDIDTVVILGDVFTYRNPTNIERKLVAEQIQRLISAGIQVLIIVGNHDVGGLSNNFSQYEHLKVENLQIVVKPEIVEVNGVGFACLPWLNKQDWGCNSNAEVEQLLAQKAMDFRKEKEGKYVPFLIGHFSILGAVIGSEKQFCMGGEELVPLSVVGGGDFEACFLGHIHKKQSFKGGNTPVMYVGSLVKCDFNERTDVKGVVVSEGEIGGKWKHKFLEIPDRDFVLVKMDAQRLWSLPSEDKPKVMFDLKPGSVVKVEVTVKKEDKALVDVKAIRQALIDCQAHWSEITVNVVGEIDRTQEFSSSLSDLDMLKKFEVDVRKCSPQVVDKVLQEGKKILEECNVGV